MAEHSTANTPAPELDRAFVRIAEGLVHYRHGGELSDAAPYPVFYAHPGSKASAYAPLIAEIARSRRIVAPDRLGSGDSAPPSETAPDIKYYADSCVRIMDALKLDKVDYFGCHTGAYMGVELLIHHPDRIHRAALDGLAVRSDEFQKTMFENYAPAVVPDDYGRQFLWAFNWVRDQSIHFPHFFRDPDHYLGLPIASAEVLHSNAVDILKCLTTYHLAYRAVFSHDSGPKLAMIAENVVPLMVMCSEEDGEHAYLDDIGQRLPWAKKVSVPGGWAGDGVIARAKAVTDFFDEARDKV
jgi:pimeloyl-ACP methyl ester carboxylesterase